MLPRPGDNEATAVVFESNSICYYPSNYPPWTPVASSSNLLALVPRTGTLAPSLIEGRGVFAARFPPLESGQGLRFLRLSWPSLLGRGSAGKEAVFAVGDRQRPRSEAHRSETHRFAYVEASKRAFSVISGATAET